jgi:hypothetical protein
MASVQAQTVPQAATIVAWQPEQVQPEQAQPVLPVALPLPWLRPTQPECL